MTARLNVLIVDDDDLTAEIVSRSLKKSGIDFKVIHASDGQEGLEIMRGQSEKRIDQPFVTLLDLNMPRMNGFEFLQAVRADPGLSSAVIFVLSTSDSDSDLVRAYRDQIAGYLLKSAVGPQMIRLTTLLGDYAHSVRLPPLPH
ncbi:response regulator [Novosphingobium sediminicola]|uniref:CheY-like chemotaxis protein n=1 Tax=Novosphingobium sediminicola TaxID=563162 RepID=A0A7W6CIJ1_9SPHN|nr:response regulator [Novosphingobium sediminicola]MBB3955043.1 CheY-like chemotaxis protein [Novosphingobium sediminicola]